MSFNLKKKSQNINKSVLPQSTALDATIERGNSLSDKDFVPNFNTLLDEDRRPIKNVVLLQSQLEEKRSNAATTDKTIEGSLNEAKSPLYPHRQVEDNDKHQVMPINILSEAYDRKYRDKFSELNKDSNTEFWDKYIGVQLDDKNRKKVPARIPASISQLPNNPNRFSNLDVMSTEDSETNRKNLGKNPTVEPMTGYAGKGKGIDMFKSLREADKLMYQMYLKAASEKRELTAVEQEVITAINNDKKKMLLAQFHPQPIQGNTGPEDRETDFLDGGQNPTAGDPVLWGQMSGVADHGDINSGELQEEVQGMPSLENLPALPQEGEVGGAVNNDFQDQNNEPMTSIKVPSAPQNKGVVDGTTPF